MNNIIGTKRTIILAILISINAGFYVLDNMYLSDQNQAVSRELRKLESEVSTLKTDTRKIEERNEELVEMAEQFESLLRQGYINNQNRVTVREGFDLMANMSRLIDAEYSVSRANIVENNFLNEAGYNFLKSDVEVRMTAIDDTRLYDFAHLIVNKYPGISNIIEFDVQKRSEVTAAALRRMSSSNPEALVSGRMEFQWLSIAPKENDPEDEG